MSKHLDLRGWWMAIHEEQLWIASLAYLIVWVGIGYDWWQTGQWHGSTKVGAILTTISAVLFAIAVWRTRDSDYKHD